MKRITNLQISNFRAFFDSYEIGLINGENLLIYGENGSGKSSLFKSLSNFLSSSHDGAFPYVTHNRKRAEEGSLSFTFNEYDFGTNTITSPFGSIINFGNNLVTSNTEQFLRTAELTKGFLDYKALLAVYNHDEAQPNLFDLIVLTLFKNFIPTHLGGTHPLGNRFNYLYEKITLAYTRKTYDYWEGIRQMEAFETLLRDVLNEVFLQLNYFLIKYFKLNLRVRFVLTPLISTGWWRVIPKELRLELKLNGEFVHHQSDFLNEARLSALSICLYLSIIKKNPQLIDFKVLFLDDIFIGLDLSNRLPILDIIKNEFAEYQTFIGTYDRHLYELAKRKFETEAPNKWKSIEMYVGTDQIDMQKVDRPILVIGESHFEKGCQYLHDRSKPDYPAAANYFRKALEQIILEQVPAYEKVDIESKLKILDYKLGPLIYKTKRFLERLGKSSETVDKIISLLPCLLHPLSHHEITSPVYKGELLNIENLIPKILSELKALNCTEKIKCSLLEGRNELIIKFIIDVTTGHFSYYHLRTTEPMLLTNDGFGAIAITPTKCLIEKCYGENYGAEIVHSRKNFSNEEKARIDNNFDSLSEAYLTLHSRMINIPAIGNFPQEGDYLDALQYLDVYGNYQPLKNIIVW